MKTLLCFIATIFSLNLFSFSAQGQDPTTAEAAPSAPKSQVAATYRGKEITLSEIDKDLARPEMSALASQAKEDPKLLNQLRASVLQTMINRELLLSAANSASLNDEEIKKEVDSFITSQGGKEKLTQFLSSHGVTWDKFTTELSDGVKIKQFIEHDLVKSISISDEDAKNAFDQEPDKFGVPERVHARHILIKTSPTASKDELDKALKKSADIYKKTTEAGANFEKIASENSEDPGSATRGGDLGFFQRGMMVPEFEQVAFSLKPGEISQPTKSQFGYHIIKVEEHKEAQKPSFDEAKEKIKESLMIQARNKALSTKVAELRKKADVKILMPELE